MWTSTALNVSKNTCFPTCVKLGPDPHVDLHCFDSNLIGIKSKKGFFYSFLRAEPLLLEGWRLLQEPGSFKRSVKTDQIGFKVIPYN
jgi:hypothetical protein